METSRARKQAGRGGGELGAAPQCPRRCNETGRGTGKGRPGTGAIVLDGVVGRSGEEISVVPRIKGMQ